MDQHRIDIHLHILLWWDRFLLGLLELVEGTESRDNLSLLSGRDGLAARLEQMQGLARFFYGQKNEVSFLGNEKNLLDMNGIDFSSLAQNSVIAMDCA